MKSHSYYGYILTNVTNSVLYVGVTNNLERRMFEHKSKKISGFTQKYNCIKLVYFEEYQWIQEAISREKQIKGGSRKKKIELINTNNSTWDDLSSGWF